jgi:hypothetical protein
MATNNDKDAPPQRRNWVSAVAPDAVRVGHAAFVRAGFPDPTLVVHWAEIAGAETARLARPLRFSQGASGGVLTLLAEPGAAIFLQHDSRALCERINTYLGRPTVSRLKFVQGVLTQSPQPQPQAKVPDTVSPADPALRYRGPDGVREALWRLARARRSQG